MDMFSWKSDSGKTGFKLGGVGANGLACYVGGSEGKLYAGRRN